MDPITLTLAVLAALSEILPLLGFTKANGILHGFKHFIVHIQAESECHVDVDATLDATAAPAAPAYSTSIIAASSAAGADGPKAIASFAETAP